MATSHTWIFLPCLQNLCYCPPTCKQVLLLQSKTECVYFGNRHLSICQHKTININRETINTSTKVKYLGSQLDEELKFKQHVQAKCKAAVINLCQIQNIRRYLAIEICHQLILSLVILHLDYRNAIPSGCSEVMIELLKKVQNMSARIMLNKHPRDSATQGLKLLHLLPIWYRIDYKVAMLVFKSIQDMAPKYLTELLTENKISRLALHSAHRNKLLTIPRTTRKTFASRAFSVYGLAVWNKLPDHIRTSANYNTFKRKLKMHLFKWAFI